MLEIKTIADLQRLIQDEIEESTVLEYKSSFAIIIAKTICTNFQNEMCIFPHFFAVRLPAWNII